jgi:hypothetical protein
VDLGTQRRVERSAARAVVGHAHAPNIAPAG